VKESFTNIVKREDGLIDFVVASIVENPPQGKARLLRPSATNKICQEEQRFHVVTLMDIQMRQLLCRGFTADR